jgi:hypothetical protein
MTLTTDYDDGAWLPENRQVVLLAVRVSPFFLKNSRIC